MCLGCRDWLGRRGGSPLLTTPEDVAWWKSTGTRQGLDSRGRARWLLCLSRVTLEKSWRKHEAGGKLSNGQASWEAGVFIMGWAEAGRCSCWTQMKSALDNMLCRPGNPVVRKSVCKGCLQFTVPSEIFSKFSPSFASPMGEDGTRTRRVCRGIDTSEWASFLWLPLRLDPPGSQFFAKSLFHGISQSPWPLDSL